MKKFAGLGIVMLLLGCGVLTPKQEGELTQVGAAILCSIEREELDDPALNDLCDRSMSQLSPTQRAAVTAHVAKVRSTRGAAKPTGIATPACGGGTKDGGT